jgi:hypothetical protein
MMMADDVWKVKPNFKKNARKDISGIVCPGQHFERCIIVNDGSRDGTVLSVQSNRSRLKPRSRFRLWGRDEGELDLEALAYDRRYVYATGPHGLPRSKPLERSPYFVYRFPYVPTMPKALTTLHSDAAPIGVERSNRLLPSPGLMHCWASSMKSACRRMA